MIIFVSVFGSILVPCLNGLWLREREAKTVMTEQSKWMDTVLY